MAFTTSELRRFNTNANPPSSQQSTPTNEQYRQVSNNAVPNKGRIGIQTRSSHRHRLGRPCPHHLTPPPVYRAASEIEFAHPGLSRQVKFGIEDDLLEVGGDGDSGCCRNGRPTSWSLGIAHQVTTTTAPARNP